MLIARQQYSPLPILPTFKVVGDNIDKYVQPREMRINAQANCLYYFNLFAVRDRVDVSKFSDDNSLPNIESIKVETIIPDSDAISCILHNFTILVGRILLHVASADTETMFIYLSHYDHRSVLK